MHRNWRNREAAFFICRCAALARIYGYDTPQQLMAELTDIGSGLYIDAAPGSEFRSLMRQDVKVQDFVSEIRPRDGSRAWISENARSVAEETGRFLFYEGTVEDVSDAAGHVR